MGIVLARRHHYRVQPALMPYEWQPEQHSRFLRQAQSEALILQWMANATPAGHLNNQGTS